MQSNQFQGSVRDLTFKGAGVVDHPDGRVFFVAGVWPGDIGIFEIERFEKRYGFAKLIELQKPSPDRVTPPCPHHGTSYGSCGGCPWMFASYEAQLRFKQKFFENRLSRLKIEIPPGVLKPVWGSSSPEGYRNRVQLKTDGKNLGFVGRETNDLVDIKDCLILNKKNRETFKELRKLLPNSSWKPSGKYRWSLLEFDDAMTAVDVKPNQKIGFRQGNTEQNFKMQGWLRQRTLGLKNKTGHELFCGEGNFTEVLAQNDVGKLLAVEMSKAAIENLKNKNLPNVKAEALDLYKPSSWSLMKKIISKPEFILLDPPREGFPDLHKYIKEFPSIQQIFYISCNPETFLEDLKPLMVLGFEANEIQTLDQFPNTPHLELLSSLQRV